jgi:hypothetical protein
VKRSEERRSLNNINPLGCVRKSAGFRIRLPTSVIILVMECVLALNVLLRARGLRPLDASTLLGRRRPFREQLHRISALDY